MDEYIKKEDVQNIIFAEDIDKDFPRMDISARIHDLPAADVAPVRRGKWEKRKFKKCAAVEFKCSVCGRESAFGVEFYCPWCGAKMEDATDVRRIDKAAERCRQDE